MAKKEKVEWGGIPTGELLKEIKAAVKAAKPSLEAIETEKAQIEDCFQEIHMKTGIPKRVFMFLLKSEYFGTAEETIQKGDDLKDAWEVYQNAEV